MLGLGVIDLKSQNRESVILVTNCYITFVRVGVLGDFLRSVRKSLNPDRETKLRGDEIESQDL